MKNAYSSKATHPTNGPHIFYAVLKLFNMKPYKAGQIHGLEPQGSLGSKIELKQNLLEFDYMQNFCTQNFDQGPPKRGQFLGPHWTLRSKNCGT